MTMKKLEKHLPAAGKILDHGGATGVYAFPLAEKGYQVYLADLSERLIDIARQKKVQSGADHLIACDVVNAIDLSIYDEEMFDVVLLFGPLYHLLEEGERKKCISEIRQVRKSLKPAVMPCILVKNVKDAKPSQKGLRFFEKGDLIILKDYAL